MKLPIDDVLPAVCESYRANRAVVLKAPPGAGKTTGVPPALFDQGLLNTGGSQRKGQLWIVQPRRLAARMVALQIAKRLGESMGQTAGYHVRHDRCETAVTRILSLTPGMFLRRMQSDPLLENVSGVVLDEFHERTTEIDLALSLVTRLRREFRDDLRIVVMSATLQPEPICEFLSHNSVDAVGVVCDGRSFPVEVRYEPIDTRKRLAETLSPIIVRVFDSSEGHVLVFLPGVGEIQWLVSALRPLLADRDCEITPLHGSLSPQAQDLATRPGSRRRVILSTNIAETSVTIDGVRAVIDSGLSRSPVVDSRTGLTRLDVSPISMASADQRAGRAGRTGPGVCVRTWDAGMNRSRKPFDAPEIVTGEFSDAMLLLASLGEVAPETLPWLEPPPAIALSAARRLLMRLNAIDEKGRLTTVGQSMSQLPLQPRLSRFVVHAIETLAPEMVASAAALLSERDPFAGRQMTFAEKTSHLAETLEGSSNRKPRRNTDFIDLNAVRRVAEQLVRQLPKPPVHRTDSVTHENDLSIELTRALLAAFPDRLAIRRDKVDDPDRGLMVGGRGVVGLKSVSDRIPGSMTATDLVLCIDVDGGGTESRVRHGEPVSRSWLDPSLVSIRDVVNWDDVAGQARCRRTEFFDDLILKETPAACVSNDETSELLYQAAVGNLSQVLPATKGGDDAWESVTLRVGMVADWDRSRGDNVVDPIEPFDDEVLRRVLRQLCDGRTSLAELRRAPWIDFLRGQLSYDQWQRVDREAPATIRLPAGVEVPIHYEREKTPWFAARIGQCFGWRETPRILGGRVSLQCHLLGPNDRPQQITEDLSSFWKNTYPVIRKELKRRYSKHHWPDDPLTATATRNGLQPR